MNQDIIDQLNEIASAYNNLVCRDKESEPLRQALDNLETIAHSLTQKLIKEHIADGE